MSKTLVIMVHGLGVQSEEWWGTTIDELNSDSELVSRDIYFKPYSYRTEFFNGLGNSAKNIFGKGSVLATLDNIGNNLISRIHSDREFQKYDDIILFGHSMGGFVIANALNYANNTLIMSALAQKISHVIMCGTPLGGANLANQAKKVFPDWYISGHIRELAKSSCIREVMAHRFNNHVEMNGITKTNLSFIFIGEDEVVSTDPERLGIFYNHTCGIHIPVLNGSHSGSVQNLDQTNENGNFGIIREHILSCYNSDISKQRREGKSERDKMREIWEQAAMAKKETRKIYFDELTGEIVENYLSILKKTKAENLEKTNTFIDLDIFYRKTFLKNGKVILDLNRTILVLDDSRSTTVELFNGFERGSKFASEKFIREELIEHFEKKCCADIDRFKEYAIDVKRIDLGIDKNQLIPTTQSNIEFEYNDSDEDTVGFKTIVDLGVHNKGDTIKVLMSYTLPTTLWIKEFENKPDKIVLPNNVLKSKIIVQEELYGEGKASLVPKVIFGNEVDGDIIRETDSSLYYKTYTAKKMYKKINESNQPLAISISKA